MKGSLAQFAEDQGGDNEQIVTRKSPLPVSDFWADHAMCIIKSTYGDIASITEKDKDLLKFGRTKVSSSTPTTIMILPAGVTEETLLDTNGITTVSSSNASDNQTIVLEGHTIDGNGDFTFTTQQVVLNGQSQVTLSTPLARANRAYNSSGTELQGSVYFYEDGTSSGGVPTASSEVHLMIDAGRQQSEKCATTISSSDYWILTGFNATVIEKTTTIAEIRLDVREKGGVFRTRDYISTREGSNQPNKFRPYLIIPPNSDVRLTAVSTGANDEIVGHIEGVLAIITE